MRVSLRAVSLGLALAGVLFGAAGQAAADNRARTYSVRITNLTKGQVITPPAVVAHRAGYSLFEIGGDASPGLTLLAETGNPALLAEEAELDPKVLAVEIGDGIPPGQSLVVHIRASRHASQLSVAAMLASTNDAFAAVHGVSLPRPFGRELARAPAYDAGTEGNNENCDFVPGPPCNATNQRDTANAEGFIHIHNGIHGGADLVPADHDWHNPVMQVEIVRTFNNSHD